MEGEGRGKGRGARGGERETRRNVKRRRDDMEEGRITSLWNVLDFPLVLHANNTTLLY